MVRYSPSRTDQGYPRTHAYLREVGCGLAYRDFLELWDQVSEDRERQAARESIEYSMEEVAGLFLRRAIVAEPNAHCVDGFVATYLEEWSAGVQLIDGVPDLLAKCGERGAVVLVTNTHSRNLIDGQLDRFQIRASFDRVLTSVEFGFRKPHPSIFHEALRGSGCRANEAVYVGDSFEADYQGARSAGIRCLLLDSENDSAKRHGIAEADRLGHVSEVEARLWPA